MQMVGPGRLELPTPRLSSVCSNQLSYGPIRGTGRRGFVFLKKEKHRRRILAISELDLAKLILLACARRAAKPTILDVLRCDRDLTGPILF